MKFFAQNSRAMVFLKTMARGRRSAAAIGLSLLIRPARCVSERRALLVPGLTCVYVDVRPDPYAAGFRHRSSATGPWAPLSMSSFPPDWRLTGECPGPGHEVLSTRFSL